MLPHLESLALLDQVGQAVLHGYAVLRVHLDLVFDPIAVVEAKQDFGQVVIGRVYGLVVHHFLLLA